MEEYGFVDEVVLEECSVEVGAAFEEKAENVAFGQGGEDSGKAEASCVVGDPVDLHIEYAESCGF